MTHDDARELLAQHESRRPDLEKVCRGPLRRWHSTDGKYMLRVENGGEVWVIKFCVNHDGKMPEVCEREVMTSLLGRAARVPTVEAWAIPATHLLPFVEPLYPSGIRDKAVLMPLLSGETADQNRTLATALVRRAPAAVADLFAFMHWVGDEDRSLSDVMLAGNQITLIDNGLCGPGDSPNLRGYHPFPTAFTEDRIVMKCYPNKASFVEFVLGHRDLPVDALAVPNAIDRIKSLSDEAVHEIVHGVGVNAVVARTLNDRKRTLVADYRDWLGRATELCR